MNKSCCFSEEGMCGLLLDYKKRLLDIAAQTLHVSLSLKNLYEAESIAFYRGNLRQYNFCCQDRNGKELSYRLVSEQIQVTTNGLSDFEVNYDIDIGKLAKHGHQGYLTPEVLVCRGENIFLLSFFSLACSDTDEQVYKSTAAISMSFDVPREWTCLLPFKSQELSLNFGTNLISRPSWSDIY